VRFDGAGTRHYNDIASADLYAANIDDSSSMLHLLAYQLERLGDRNDGFNAGSRGKCCDLGSVSVASHRADYGAFGTGNDVCLKSALVDSGNHVFDLLWCCF
jgi:hypothetical protein